MLRHMQVLASTGIKNIWNKIHQDDYTNYWYSLNINTISNDYYDKIKEKGGYGQHFHV